MRITDHEYQLMYINLVFSSYLPLATVMKSLWTAGSHTHNNTFYLHICMKKNLAAVSGILLWPIEQSDTIIMQCQSHDSE